jgi:hypothetical protein
MIIVGVLAPAGVLVTYLLAGDQQDGEEASSTGALGALLTRDVVRV